MSEEAQMSPAELLERYKALKYMIQTVYEGDNAEERDIAIAARAYLEERCWVVMGHLLRIPGVPASTIATAALSRAQASVRAARKAKLNRRP